MERYAVEICDIETCIYPHNMKLRKLLSEEIAKNMLEDKVDLVIKGCIGHCAPFVVVQDSEGNRFLYSDLNEEKVKLIVWEHFNNDKPVADLAIRLA